jgi:processive 1,2-diacylglycerol beta-glucosyltransferase
VYVATVQVGAGHRDAAEALIEPMQRRWPNASIELLELLDLTPRWFRRLYGGGYSGLASRYPLLYWWLFQQTDEPLGRQAAPGERRRIALEASSLQRFLHLVHQTKPDLVVQTHFLGAATLGRAIHRGEIRTRHCVVVTDYEAHRAWRCDAADRYFVPTPLAKAAMQRSGIDPGRILITGVPITEKWIQPIDPQWVRDEWHLPGDRPIVLLMGGTLFSTGPLHHAADEVLNSGIDVQLVILAGKNQSLVQRLSQRYANRPYVRVQGYTTRLNELFTVADVLISKPGGLVASQAMQKHLPMIIIHPVPGQEMANADYLLTHGAAVKCNNLRTLSAQLRWLLDDREALNRMRESAGRLARPRAAEDIADELARLFATSARQAAASA